MTQDMTAKRLDGKHLDAFPERGILVMTGVNVPASLLRELHFIEHPEELKQTVSEMRGASAAGATPANAPERGPSAIVRQISARAIGGVGYAMIAFEACKGYVAALRDHYDAQDLVHTASRAHIIEDMDRKAPAFLVGVEEGGPFLMDEVDEMRPRIRFASFRHKDRPGVLAKLTTGFIERGISICQHDAVFRRFTEEDRKRFGTPFLCDHTFRLRTGTDCGQALFEALIREILDDAFDEDAGPVKETLDTTPPQADRGMVPGSLPVDRVLADEHRFAYVIVQANDALGSYGACVEAISHARPTAGKKVAMDANRSLIRAAARSFCGHTCMVMCAPIEADDNLDAIRRHIKAKLEKVDGVDLKRCEVFDSRNVPWLHRQNNEAFLVNRDVHADEDGLMRRLIEHLGDSDRAAYDLVQFDSWAQSRALHEKPRCFWSFGALTENKEELEQRYAGFFV
ncbi:MAG: hypothetical protein AAF356_13080 [Planctomycetota bacterium]